MKKLIVDQLRQGDVAEYSKTDQRANLAFALVGAELAAAS